MPGCCCGRLRANGLKIASFLETTRVDGVKGRRDRTGRRSPCAPGACAAAGRRRPGPGPAPGAASGWAYRRPCLNASATSRYFLCYWRVLLTAMRAAQGKESQRQACNALTPRTIAVPARGVSPRSPPAALRRRRLSRSPHRRGSHSLCTLAARPTLVAATSRIPLRRP